MSASTNKKLLVLDLDGFLVDSCLKHKPKKDRPSQNADLSLGRSLFYFRPFWREFLQFCFEHFLVGIWTCKKKKNADGVVRCLLDGANGQLAFLWCQEHCTTTRFRDPDNRFKPMFLKDLSKLWAAFKPDLPWEQGEYGPYNTLLIDDTPYKSICNPPYTAIFPPSFSALSSADDLLSGQLRSYLQQLLCAVNVQSFVKENPFGQPHVNTEDPLWKRLMCVENSLKDIECIDTCSLKDGEQSSGTHSEALEDNQKIVITSVVGLCKELEQLNMENRSTVHE